MSRELESEREMGRVLEEYAKKEAIRRMGGASIGCNWAHDTRDEKDV